MRALSMALKWMSLNRRKTLYVRGRVIFAEDSDTGRSKSSANGSSCVSIVHIVLMRGRKSDISSGKKPKACCVARYLPFTTGAFGSRRVGGRQNGGSVRQRLYPTRSGQS